MDRSFLELVYRILAVAALGLPAEIARVLQVKKQCVASDGPLWRC